MSDIVNRFPEDPLPPSHVDVSRAMAAGRRRRRARTGLLAAGAVAALTVGAVSAPRLLSYLPGQSSIAPGTGDCASGPLPSQAPANPDSPAYLDVLRRWIGLSALSGYELNAYGTSPNFQTAEVTSATGESVSIVLYATNGAPHVRLTNGAPAAFNPAAGTPTDPVGRHPAYVLPGEDYVGYGSGLGLAWQWAPGAWVVVRAADPDDPGSPTAGTRQPRSAARAAAMRTAARQVAEALQLGPGDPIVAPFAMPVPGCTRLIGTGLMYDTAGNGTPFSRFMLVFGDEGAKLANNPLLLPGDGTPTISVTADSVAIPESKPGSVNDTLDGHPVARMGGFIVVHGVDGFAFEITAPEAAVDDIFESITVFPGAHDSRSSWAPPITP